MSDEPEVLARIEGRVGRITLEQALDQTLDGARCAWRIIAPGAVQISPIPKIEPPKLESPVTLSDVLVTATKRVRNARELACGLSGVGRTGRREPGPPERRDGDRQV
eukprot:gene41762-56538_t